MELVFSGEGANFRGARNLEYVLAGRGFLNVSTHLPTGRVVGAS